MHASYGEHFRVGRIEEGKISLAVKKNMACYIMENGGGYLKSSQL